MFKGIDLSNYSGPLNSQHVRAIREDCDFVIIGLQDEATARQQSEALTFVHQEYYLTSEHQNIHWLPEAARVWLDVEEGCIETPTQAALALAKLANRRLFPGWYSNEPAWMPRLASMGNLISGPLWWASWGIEPMTGYRPWAQFDSLMVHQVGNAPDSRFPNLQALQLNCDINYSTEDFLPPRP